MTARPSSREIRSNVRHEPSASRETSSSERPSRCLGIPGSGGKALDPPAPIGARGVHQPVVHAAGSVLPELEPFRREAVPAPVVSERHALSAGVATGELAGAFLEPFAARDGLALG